jgi:hypothetical protein
VLGGGAIAAALALAWRQSRRLHSSGVGMAPHAVAALTAVVVLLALAGLALLAVR